MEAHHLPDHAVTLRQHVQLARVVHRETQVHASPPRDRGGAGEHAATTATRAESVLHETAKPGVDLVHRRDRGRVTVVGTENIAHLGVPDVAGRNVAEQQLARERRNP